MQPYALETAMTPNELVIILEKHECYLNGLVGAAWASLSQENL